MSLLKKVLKTLNIILSNSQSKAVTSRKSEFTNFRLAFSIERSVGREGIIENGKLEAAGLENRKVPFARLCP